MSYKLLRLLLEPNLGVNYRNGLSSIQFFRLKFKQIISKGSVNNNLLANIGAGKTHLYDSVDILSSVETHKVHGKHLKLIRPVLELTNVFFQIQPENNVPRCSQHFQLEFSPSIN